MESRDTGEMTLGDRPEDLTKGKDVIFTTKVIKYLLKQHTEWHEIGLAYDSGSSLFTTKKLMYDAVAVPVVKGVKSDADYEVSSTSGVDFDREALFEEDIKWPGSTKVNLKIVIAPVKFIATPIDGKYIVHGTYLKVIL